MRSRSRTRARRRFAGAAIFAFLPVVVALASAPVVLAVQKVVVAPSNGVVGATVKATASGFPLGTVEFWWDGTDLLGSAVVVDSHAVSLTFQIPTGASLGLHNVRACVGVGCPTTGTFDDTKVTVVAPTPPPPTPTPVPTPTPFPTVAPTPAPTVAPTPTPPGQTPGPTPRPTAIPTPTPTLRPGQTPNPTPVPTLPSGSPAPAGSDAVPSESALPGSPDASPGWSPVASAIADATAGTLVPDGETSPAPATGQPAAGPTADAGPPVLPIGIGALGAAALLGVFLTLRRRRPSPRSAAATASQVPSTALPTSWAVPADEPSPALAPAHAVESPGPAPAAGSQPASAWPATDQAPRQRTIVVHVTPKDPGQS